MSGIDPNSESTGELQRIGTMRDGNELWGNYPGRVEEDGTIIITGTITRRYWDWRRFRMVLVEEAAELGKFFVGGGSDMTFGRRIKPGGPLNLEVRNADGNVISSFGVSDE